jgi:peptidoglycan/LPS O-acetylase OafA/YrhL
MALCAVAVAALQLTDKGVMAVTADSPVLQACFDILLAIGTGMLCVTLVSVRSTRISTAAVPLAAFSYTLYLTHFPFLVALERGGWKRMSRLDASTFGIYSAIVVACTLSAWGMYWLFEKHTPRVRTAMKRVGRRSQISVAAS